jgi:uncharacterized protein (TIGR03067 family)
MRFRTGFVFLKLDLRGRGRRPRHRRAGLKQDEAAVESPLCLKRYAYHIGAVGMVILIATATGYSDADNWMVAARVARLVAQLGADKFAQREGASKELESIGEPALPALREAAASNDDVEIRRRAEMIIQAIAGLVTKRELTRLQGAWCLLSYETDGKRIKGEDQAHVFTFEGEKWSLRVGGQVFQAGTVQRIEVKQKFNAIDLLITGGGGVDVTTASIYSLKGESLKYVNGNPRPTEFVTKRGDGRHYLTFRRAKP